MILQEKLQMLRKKNDYSQEQLADIDIDETIHFLIRAKQNTYSGHAAEIKPSRVASHDLKYEEGNHLYYDTYLGGQNFSGEEAIWLKENLIWCMNYSGRVLGEKFNGDFLKEVLYHNKLVLTCEKEPSLSKGL